MAVAAASAQPVRRIALVAGANGLTGSSLVRLLVLGGHYDRVEALTRRPLPMENPRLVNRILNYEELAARLAGSRCDDAFCCLGAAGGPRADPASLRKVDLNLTLAFGRAARAAGASRLVVISTARASQKAHGEFQRIKAEMEVAVRDLQFAAVDILQPWMVVGDRPGGRAVETLRQLAAPLVNLTLAGKFSDLRWVGGDELAAAMLGAARGQRRGVNTYSGKKLQQLTSAGTGRG